jgi:hypothetical protein
MACAAPSTPSRCTRARASALTQAPEARRPSSPIRIRTPPRSLRSRRTRQPSARSLSGIEVLPTRAAWNIPLRNWPGLGQGRAGVTLLSPHARRRRRKRPWREARFHDNSPDRRGHITISIDRCPRGIVDCGRALPSSPGSFAARSHACGANSPRSALRRRRGRTPPYAAPLLRRSDTWRGLR